MNTDRVFVCLDFRAPITQTVKLPTLTQKMCLNFDKSHSSLKLKPEVNGGFSEVRGPHQTP